MCVTGIWIGRRIKPAANLKFARKVIDPGALICAEDQFVGYAGITRPAGDGRDAGAQECVAGGRRRMGL